MFGSITTTTKKEDSLSCMVYIIQSTWTYCSLPTYLYVKVVKNAYILLDQKGFHVIWIGFFQQRCIVNSKLPMDI